MGCMKLRYSVMTGALACAMFALLAGQAQAGQAQAGQTNVAQQSIPNAPRPQPTLPDLGLVTPGRGTTSVAIGSPVTAASPSLSTSSDSGSGGSPSSASTAQTGDVPPEDSEPTPEKTMKVEETLRVQVNNVEVPFSVTDSKGRYVAGLTSKDVQVFENGRLQHIVYFTPDFHALSVALVIDQSMTHDDMVRLNDSLGALQDAFTKYDEVAVFTYNNGPRMVTDFTGAQSPRLTQAINDSKGSGTDPLLAGSLSGPMAQTTVVNNMNFDPNTAAIPNHMGLALNVPRPPHTLNDAILAAATALSNRPLDRRRVIYVISDGKEYGSKAKTKEVIKYLQTNNIEVDGTVVGDSALPVVGFLNRMHLPLTMRDNILPQYAKATGGNFDAEYRIGGIERSFAKIASEVRNRYTLDYDTHEPPIDGKYRTLEVRVLNHGNDLTILAPAGYWPSAIMSRPRAASPAQ